MPFLHFCGAIRPARPLSQRRTGQVAPLRLLQGVAILVVIMAIVRLAHWAETAMGGRPAFDPYAPAIEAEGIESVVVRDKDGGKAWEFAADKVEVSSDNLYMTVTNLKRGTWFKDGKPFLQLQASRVSLNQQTRDLQATGKVTAQGPDGFSVQSERALWSNLTQQLECPGEVRATLRGLSFQTRQVFYEARSGQLRCPGKVQVDSSRATLNGANVMADAKQQRVKFKGEVEIVIHSGTTGKKK